eukprot:TRINITY_DN1868_c0_g1_i2.p1 TRINITY_DN1868_c0_g1~~TRINITY_DN1868_c0_g1_i2.p1  ORF type:complete len:189 (+),score=42.26 TRINITY_DN1868_c0_g1_i2:128-694(+)
MDFDFLNRTYPGKEPSAPNNTTTNPCAPNYSTPGTGSSPVAGGLGLDDYFTNLSNTWNNAKIGRNNSEIYEDNGEDDEGGNNPEEEGFDNYIETDDDNNNNNTNTNTNNNTNNNYNKTNDNNNNTPFHPYKAIVYICKYWWAPAFRVSARTTEKLSLGSDITMPEIQTGKLRKFEKFKMGKFGVSGIR